MVIKKKPKKLKKKKISIRKQIAEKDLIWKKAIKKRDNYICQMCGQDLSKNMIRCHAAHIIPRVFRLWRWELNNGITLCYRDHIVGPNSCHKHPLFFTKWLKINHRGLYDIAIYRLKNLNNFEVK